MKIAGARTLKQLAADLKTNLVTLRTYHKAGMIDFTNISAGSKRPRYVVTDEQVEAFLSLLKSRTVSQTSKEDSAAAVQLSTVPADRPAKLRVKRHV